MLSHVAYLFYRKWYVEVGDSNRRNKFVDNRNSIIWTNSNIFLINSTSKDIFQFDLEDIWAVPDIIRSAKILFNEKSNSKKHFPFFAFSTFDQHRHLRATR